MAAKQLTSGQGELQGAGKGEHPGEAGRDVLTEAVPDHRGGLDTPGHELARQRVLDGEQRAGHSGALVAAHSGGPAGQPFARPAAGTPQGTAACAGRSRARAAAARRTCPPRRGTPARTGRCPGPCRGAASRRRERRRPRAGGAAGRALGHQPARLLPDQRPHRVGGVGADRVAADTEVSGGRPGRVKATSDIRIVRVCLFEEVGQLPGRGVHGLPGCGPRAGAECHGRSGAAGRSRGRRLLQDDVRVGAADAERADPGPPRQPARPPVDGDRRHVERGLDPAAARGWARRSWRSAGSGRGRSASAARMSPATPAAASRCPMLALTEPSAHWPGAGWPGRPERLGQGGDLDRVADLGGGAVASR